MTKTIKRKPYTILEVIILLSITNIYRYNDERLYMDNKEFYEIFIKSDFEEKFIPKIFENISKQYLEIKNKAKEINPPFYNIGTYWCDDKENKKFTDNIINEEITQLTKLNINY